MALGIKILHGIALWWTKSNKLSIQKDVKGHDTINSGYYFVKNKIKMEDINCAFMFYLLNLFFMLS
jgi:hypothetical protein